ncbi:hypothetical protein FH595_02255 [Leptospira interrogans]|nr:hypothetical protein [Leptospira interrogans]ULG80866.1 hypothetical protein FH595_02255 [Leptospira interrogans]
MNREKMLPKDIDKTDEEVLLGILNGINEVNSMELNHSEVYDPYLAVTAIENANKIMAEYNSHGLSPAELMKRIRKASH